MAEHATRKAKVPDTRTSQREDQNTEKPGEKSGRAFRDFLRPPGLTKPKLSWVVSSLEVPAEEKISR